MRQRMPAWPGALALAGLFALWLALPETDAAREALARCGSVIVPTLLPFLALSGLFVRRGYTRYAAGLLRPLARRLGAGTAGAFAVGAVGGYPAGAAAVFTLYDQGQLDRQQAARALAFCNNAGPGFLLGVCGLGLFGSVRAGLLLWAVHLLSALAVGLLTARGERPSPAPAPAETEPWGVSLVEAVRAAAGAMVQICALVVCFAAVTASLQRLPAWPLLPPWCAAAVEGFLELTGGTAALAGLPTETALPLCGFLAGWGGLCVHAQVLAVRGKRPVPLRWCVAGKLAQGLLSAALLRLAAAGDAVPLLTLAAMAALRQAVLKRAAGNPGTFRV